MLFLSCRITYCHPPCLPTVWQRSQNDQCIDLIIKINFYRRQLICDSVKFVQMLATDAFSTIFILNSFFIKCTLLFADGFSYIPDKAFIRSAVVFSFTTLCATNLDRVNLITPSTCLSRRAYSSAFIASSFVPKISRCNFLL